MSIIISRKAINDMKTHLSLITLMILVSTLASAETSSKDLRLLKKASSADSNKGVGDSDRGSKLYEKKCKVCHAITDKKKIGPGFRGVFGRESKVNGMKGYKLDEAGIKRWLKSPKSVLPKSKMGKMAKGHFASLSDSQIDDIIAFLSTL